MRHPASDSVNVSTWLSLRFQRDTRDYQLHLEQDLWGARILTRVNGRRNSRLGRALMTWPGSFESGLSALAKSAERRRLPQARNADHEKTPPRILRLRTATSLLYATL